MSPSKFCLTQTAASFSPHEESRVNLGKLQLQAAMVGRHNTASLFGFAVEQMVLKATDLFPELGEVPAARSSRSESLRSLPAKQPTRLRPISVLMRRSVPVCCRDLCLDLE
ncbi:unnamed protein product [Effrenium voratum]|uniref:Uncharacterized protein n=1 Tax=Effrenium voratum TaxID=2562239 RepID=A0AA36JQ37_9DINO|nr:unnamed protein product [Effrenium voratum]CAJ1432141.1 unnamed protein product [Effrenium voratum]